MTAMEILGIFNEINAEAFLNYTAYIMREKQNTEGFSRRT